MIALSNFLLIEQRRITVLICDYESFIPRNPYAKALQINIASLCSYRSYGD